MFQVLIHRALELHKSECYVDVLAAEQLSLVMRDNSHDEEGNANVNAHELITNDRGK